MRERFEQMHALATKGLSKEAIARQLGVNRQTVCKYLRLKEPPKRRPGSRMVSALTPYEGYLLRRWAEGCHNARQLWREIQCQGYGGCAGYFAHATKDQAE